MRNKYRTMDPIRIRLWHIQKLLFSFYLQTIDSGIIVFKSHNSSKSRHTMIHSTPRVMMFISIYRPREEFQELQLCYEHEKVLGRNFAHENIQELKNRDIFAAVRSEKSKFTLSEEVGNIESEQRQIQFNLPELKTLNSDTSLISLWKLLLSIYTICATAYHCVKIIQAMDLFWQFLQPVPGFPHHW